MRVVKLCVRSRNAGVLIKMIDVMPMAFDINIVLNGFFHEDCDLQ